jgi:predicted CxxxxCH...CXXCH cytochrome family protein
MRPKMKFYTNLMFFTLLFLAIIGCSETTEEITPPKPTHHPEGFGDPSSPKFHKYVFANHDWGFNLTKCQSCHAADYSGGTANVGCLTCHTNSSGPEACNTCHGNFADSNFTAPPNDLEDNSDKSFKGVGAHYAHVYNNSTSTNVGCFECHKLTDNGKFVHAHISPPPAKMEFGDFTNPDSSYDVATYDFGNATCSNTYCHGAFKFAKSTSDNKWGYADDFIVGNNYTPTWNSTTDLDAECGTCHGKTDANGILITPQPTGHFGNYLITDCAQCHNTVVDANGKIIDKQKHINKLADFHH